MCAPQFESVGGESGIGGEDQRPAIAAHLRVLNPWVLLTLEESISTSRPLTVVEPPGATYQEDAFDAESVTSLVVRFSNPSPGGCANEVLSHEAQLVEPTQLTSTG